MKKAFIMLSGLTTLCPLVAEEMQPDTLRNIQLEEVVISATRAKQTTPISFSDIPEDVIKKNNFGRDIPYIIALTPSVTVTSDAGTGIGYTAFRVRGTDVNRINITINGIPYNDPESHGAFFVDLPDIASSLSSMQIQRGVGTSTNGAAAFGASVNMQTENLNLEPYAEIGASGGSFNTIRTTVKAGSGLINDHFMVDGRYSVINSDGYIDRAWVDMQSYHLSAAYATDKTLIKLLTFAGKETTYQAWNGVDLDLVQREPLKYTRHYNDLGVYRRRWKCPILRQSDRQLHANALPTASDTRVFPRISSECRTALYDRRGLLRRLQNRPQIHGISAHATHRRWCSAEKNRSYSPKMAR